MTLPNPTLRIDCFANASSKTPVASIGSFGRPMVRAKTFVEPPGSTAKAVSVRARAVLGGLVLGAVSAEGDDDVDSVRGRALRETGGMPPPTRFGE